MLQIVSYIIKVIDGVFLLPFLVVQQTLFKLGNTKRDIYIVSIFYIKTEEFYSTQRNFLCDLSYHQEYNDKYYRKSSTLYHLHLVLQHEVPKCYSASVQPYQLYFKLIYLTFSFCRHLFLGINVRWRKINQFKLSVVYGTYNFYINSLFQTNTSYILMCKM